MNGGGSTPGPTLRPFHRWGRWLGVLGVLLLAVGCASPQLIDIGERANVQNLDRLISEKSTAAEVTAALGTPRGYGGARFTKDHPHRKVWYYEFLQIKGLQAGLNILLVFFKDDRYEGYLWFSAKELFKGLPS